MQIVKLCDMPEVQVDFIDNIVWEWAKMIIENPECLKEGLDGIQRELQHENKALIERLGILEDQVAQYQSQLDRLLDLYLVGEFPKEVLTERKARLGELLFNLGREQNDLLAHIKQATMTDDQLTYIKKFCAKIRKGLDKADFNTKRQIIELLDVRGKYAYENGEKVIYIKCLLETSQEQQPVSRLLISPSSSIGGIAIMNCAFQLMVQSQ